MNKIERACINNTPFANAFQKKIARGICLRMNYYAKYMGVNLPAMFIEDTYTQDDKRKSHLALSWREQTNQEVGFQIFEGGAVEISCIKFDPPSLEEYKWHGHYIDPFPEVEIEEFVSQFSKGDTDAIDEGTSSSPQGV